MLRRLFLWIQKYERHLSALAMIAGFIADSLLFERVDLWQTQAVFATYAAICFITIPLLHFLEARSIRPRWRSLLPIATQFALGGFWSGFIIFYGRSAYLGASWPFLLFLVIVLLANEYFKRYHDQLVFTSVLFFFALYSYAIFAVPVFTGSIGTLTFIESSVIAVAVFALFTMLLRALARERFFAYVWRIRVGAFAVLCVMLFSYGSGILPPLPLSAPFAGVYQSVWRASGTYMATSEKEPWQVRILGFAPTVHLALGDSLSVYSAVFAPTALTTTVNHRWQRHDAGKKQWITKAVIAFPILGGRDGGYRGYSTVRITEAGQWRVNVETEDGRLITQLPFTVVEASSSAPGETITLE